MNLKKQLSVKFAFVYDKESANGGNGVRQEAKFESGQMMLKKVRWTYSFAYL